MSTDRHFFPGNNTPKGFFSFYKYILSQREANRIYCIKGGPGAGKSSFMKNIAKDFSEAGEDIDFLHCSSDPASLDGIILKNKKIAFIDATSPHMMDPINPGAVDSIIHLGDYWNEEKIRQNREQVLRQNETCKRFFQGAYNYIAAAEKIYDNIEAVYSFAQNQGYYYKLAAEIVNRELSAKKICLTPGRIKKFFASAITPDGVVSYVDSILRNIRKIYILHADIGENTDGVIRILSEGAVYRGLSVEEFYCSLKPDMKLEHLIIPELSLAVITDNPYHPYRTSRIDDKTFSQVAAKADIMPSHVMSSDVMSEDIIVGNYISGDGREVIDIDFQKVYDMDLVRERAAFLELNLKEMKHLLRLSVKELDEARISHGKLEDYYIPNMDFCKIDLLRKEIVAKLL